MLVYMGMDYMGIGRKPMILLLSYVLIFTVYCGSVSGLSSDEKVLVKLVSRWEAPKSVEFGWNSTKIRPCLWKGVKCDKTQNVVLLNFSHVGIFGNLGPEIGQLGYVRTVDLNSNSFSGSIPGEITNCVNLVYLDLSLNKLNGSIPESLFLIPHLQTLSLAHNSLTGSIPENIGNATELVDFEATDNLLSGSIPSSIGNCSALEYLYLDGNHLDGVLPRGLNNLANLIQLYLNSNRFEGAIPLGSGSCKNLLQLDLADNHLQGVLPPGLGNCSSLIAFSVVRNSLTGSIPSSFGHLTNLTTLYLAENRLSGKIPPELGNCKSLSDLDLSDNILEGEIPSELGKLSQLTYLQLFSNSLIGEVPPDIWKMQSLDTLLIYNNSLSGELPLELTELRNLRNITLSDNQFTGIIPRNLGVNSSLEAIDFTNNKFTGEIPPYICSSKRLVKLDLGDNMLNGSIPPSLGSCSSLIRLRLENNKLTGVLPEFKQNISLSFMDLSANKFHGKVPSSLGNCRSLSWINFTVNELSGTLPPELGNLTELGYLDLSHNRLEGPLPSELSQWQKLLKLDLSSNLFSGSIPTSLSSLSALSIINLRENRLSGGIPRFLFELESLQELKLGGNVLGGTIPFIGSANIYTLDLSSNGLTGPLPDMSMLNNLQELDVSHNSLTGTLHSLDNRTSLVTINVSDNLFSGPVSATLLNLFNKSPSSFLGNSKLCVDCPISGGSNCTGNGYISVCSRKRNKHLRNVQIALIVVGATLLTVVVALSLCYACIKFRTRSKNDIEDSGKGCSSIKLNQIMESTGNLSNMYVIGKGAHGVVYKASLGPEEVYAVKKLVFGRQIGANKSMIREIQTLGTIKHRNLVKIKDYWLRNDYGLIMYEYMENGSLGHCLHRTSPPTTLKWDVRYKIALGTAQGLVYLHFDSDPVILHRDIKPENILLDSDMEAHISDFGIAKLMDQSSSSSTQSIAIPGTIGYIAPENAFATTWTKESDVYSYGVVLLELLTRKQAVDPSFPEGMDLVGWVRSVWNCSEQVDKVVDAALLDEFQDSQIMEQVYDAFFIAMRCTEREPRRRPTMRDVVKQLEDSNPSTRTRKSPGTSSRS